MNKVTFPNIKLDCYLQNKKEIDYNECHKGVITRNRKGGFRFEETVAQVREVERNPHIFEGRHINVGRCQKDGSLTFNFKRVDTNAPGFNPDDFAFGVYCELTKVLTVTK